eukprot:2179152-Pyramimonas_sp.AAC.1
MEHILRASYGERRQGNASEEQKKAGRVPRTQAGAVEINPLPAPYRPPFWQSKLYGEPFGDFKRDGRRPVSAREVDAAKRPVATQRPASARQGAATAPRTAVPKLPVKEGKAGVRNAAVEPSPSCPPGRLQQLEDSMKRLIMKKRVLHEKIEQPLERAFRHYDTNNNGKVDTRHFVAAWERLGLKVTPTEACAIFNKYGKDQDGYMPYKVFISGLMVGKSRLL